MKKSLRLMLLVALMGVASGCDGLLESDPAENNITNISQDVDFEAKSATYKHFSGENSYYPQRENFVIELLGSEGSVRDAMILDLLTPKGQTTPVGRYIVGSKGDYLALPKYDVLDSTTGLLYMGGSYYGRAVGGYIKDYFGFLTEGEVNICALADGGYSVVVDGKSGNYTIKVRYEGEITQIQPK